MSNNAAVTADGGEIGRAQALQARAARVAPSVDMNPVLLKPQSEVGSQSWCRDKCVGTARAREYQALQAGADAVCARQFCEAAASADLVLVEGAGSASEVNLRANDIANMGFARAADAPVVLIGDIDRGGVIASLCGTAAVVDPEDGKLIEGFHRQQDARRSLAVRERHAFVAERTGWAPIGLVPHFRRCASAAGRGRLALDALPISAPIGRASRAHRCARVAAYRQFRRSRSAAARAGRRTHPVAQRRAAAGRYRSRDPAGSKATIADLAALRAPAGTPISLRMLGAADACSACAAATRCSAAASAIPTVSKGRRVRLKDWA